MFLAFVAQGLVLSSCLALVIEVYRVINRRRKNPLGLPMPPGPPGKFLIGNLYDMPTSEWWITYTEWGKKYGELVAASVFGCHIIIVNSREAATELFERRSSIYSGRPQMPMLAELMGWKWNFAFQGYGETWRRHRKLYHQQFHPEASRAYFPIQRSTTFRLLLDLLDSPEEFMSHIKQMTGESILTSVYGYKPQRKNDYLIQLAETANAEIVQAATPGKYMVDFLPILQHVPEWFPGADFKRKARVWKAQGYRMRDLPFAGVQKSMASGNYPFSFCSELIKWLDGRDDRKEWEEHVKTAAGVAYAAGSESKTTAALTSFIIAMVLHPDAQRRAQAEIDLILGSERLPDFEDRQSLPYVEAVIKEVHRLYPVAPIALPHQVIKDDYYKGYFIPKGATVIGNTWSILHDEQLYPEPLKFEPERYLVGDFKTRKVTTTASFGYGRRVCPGRYLADSTMWHAAACILAVFDIGYAKDEQGGIIYQNVKWSSALVCRPEAFQCSINPRSDAARLLIKDSLRD